MTYSEPSFSVNVDVSNPGQFFACCGLLELAHRLWPGAEGWFDSGRFNIILKKAERGALSGLIDHIRASKWQEDGTKGVKSIHPIWCDQFIPLLDWWLRADWYHFKDKPGLMSTPLKLWAGNQSSLQIASKLIVAFPHSTISATEGLFDCSVPLTGRYGVDPRAAWNALDAGFSPNNQGMTVNTYPAVEMLGAIGLQRFRPIPVSKDTLCYAIWQVPLVPSVAAACAALLPAKFIRRWQFLIVDRGSYKGFGFALPVGDQT
jgi:CRISPR-associated protein Csx14